MSEILNRAWINAVLGAGSVVLNDYALNITPIERGYRLTVKRGSDTQTMDILDGVGIVGIEKTGSTGDVDSYRITFTDGSTFDYTVETNAAAHAAAEAARVEAENSRAGAEAARESAEAGRVNAEDARVEAEAARESAETARASAESARAQAEDGRQSAEAARVAAEQSRASAESVRAAAENARVAAETARANAENERAGAEALRSAAEADRANAESGRVSAEQGRVSAESERVAAEEARATEFAGFSGEIAQLKDGKLDKTGTAADSDKLGGQLPEHYATAQSVNQLKDDVAAITPDDTTVDGKPWTSKKIVDSLCQPFEESGNPVQVYPVEGYPLGVKSRIDAVQDGTGDPSPDNVRPIVGWDSVEVTLCGKNLYKNIGNITMNGVTFTANDDGSITANGTATGDAFYTVNYNHALQPGTYTLSGAPHTLDNSAYLYFYPGYKLDIGDGVTFILTDAVDKYSISIHVHKGYVADNFVFRPQLELGSTATPYEPYTGSTTDIALPETVYGGTLDVETGVVTVDTICETVTGAESSRFIDEPSDKQFSFVLKKTSDSGISSHYKSLSNNDKNNGVFGVYLNTTYKAIFNSGFDTLDDFKAYLSTQNAAGTPMQLCYKILDPYTIQLTSQQIAALSGVNTLYTDAGTLTVTGREDPRHTIVELKNAILSLGGNI